MKKPTKRVRSRVAWFVPPDKKEGPYHAGSLWHNRNIAEFVGNGKKPVRVRITPLGRGRK